MLRFSVFFFNDTATTEIYTLSLHDALPIWALELWEKGVLARVSNLAPPCLCTSSCGLITCANGARVAVSVVTAPRDRKSTRLNSSHLVISYAVFCLKKKKNKLDFYLFAVES